jgi:hypothetical protein
MQAITPNTNPKKSQHIKFGINKLGTLLSSQTTDILDPGSSTTAATFAPELPSTASFRFRLVAATRNKLTHTSAPHQTDPSLETSVRPSFGGGHFPAIPGISSAPTARKRPASHRNLPEM